MNTSRLFRNFIFLFSLLGLGSVVWGDRFEILKGELQSYSGFVEVAVDEIAIVESFYISSRGGSRGYIYITDENETEHIQYEKMLDGSSQYSSYGGFSSDQKLTIPGACKIRIKQTSGENGTFVRAYIYVQKKTAEAPSRKFATVIPENSENNVSIILEQSTDLINWTSATPGVFAPSTSKRFFRVRSEEE